MWLAMEFVDGIHVEGDDIVTRGFSGELSRWTLPRPEQVIKECGDHERCVIMNHEEITPKTGAT
jgi:hypothetical protein